MDWEIIEKSIKDNALIGKKLMKDATVGGKFYNIEVLYEWLWHGHEYGFIYKDKEYFICNGYVKNTDKLNLRVLIIDIDQVIHYNSVGELFDNFVVDGKSFREFFLDVDVIDEF